MRRVSGTIGFVGLGAMGGAMAEQLLHAGVSVRAFARSPEVVEAFGARGASTAASLTTLAEGCRVTIVCVFDDAQVREVVLGPGGLLEGVEPGATVVIHTTCRPTTIDAIAEALAERGAHVVDAPVSGSPVDVRVRRLTLMVGGDDDVVAACQSLFAAYASPVVHVGPVGNGQRVKLINNVLLAASVQLIAEAYDLGEALGVAPALLTAALAHGSARSRAIELIEMFGSLDAFAEVVGPFLAKDVAAVRDSAEEAGVDLGVLGQLAGGDVG